MQNSLDDKIDKLTSMVSKLTTQDNNQNKHFKSKIYKERLGVQSRNSYSDCANYQNRYRLNSRDRRTSFSGRGQYGQNYRGRLHYVNNYRNDFRKDNFREIQNSIGQNFRGGCRRNKRNNNFGTGEVGLGTDDIQVILEGMTEVVAVGQGQVQEHVITDVELDASNVGNTNISLRTVQLCKWKKDQNKYNKCII